MPFISGPYTATYGSTPITIGKVEDGFTISYRRFSERIITDTTGDSLQDAVYRGQEMTISFILSEWDLALAAGLLNPFSTDADDIAELGEIGRVGKLDSSFAAPLVLTSCASAAAAPGWNLPALSNPDTITFHRTLLSPDFDVSYTFASRHRKIPMQLTVYPVVASGESHITPGQCTNAIFFTATNAS